MPKRRQTGQTATPQAAASPAIITTVDEVNLDMVVHNKENKPVLDFKPEDVSVTDVGPAGTTLRICGLSLEHPGHSTWSRWSSIASTLRERRMLTPSPRKFCG
jgi:hypothetical protein